jgi:hypothetical protein
MSHRLHITKQNLALFFASTFMPMAVLAGVKVGGLMKLMNPDDIDVTQDLAYLGYIVISAVVIGLLWVFVAVFLCILLYREDKSFVRAKMPLTILVVNIFIAASILIFREVDGSAQDNWSRDHNQPTRQEHSEQLDKYFKALEDQKQLHNE